MNLALAKAKVGSPDVGEESLFVKTYLSTPADTETALGQGWNTQNATNILVAEQRVHTLRSEAVQTAHDTIRVVVHDESLDIPKFLNAGGILVHQPGEITSEAPSLRKNADRTLEARKAQGRKIGQRGCGHEEASQIAEGYARWYCCQGDR
jgi:hypothetical protein